MLNATGDEEASEPPTEGVGMAAPVTVCASRRCSRSRIVLRAAFGLSEELKASVSHQLVELNGITHRAGSINGRADLLFARTGYTHSRSWLLHRVHVGITRLQRTLRSLHLVHLCQVRRVVVDKTVKAHRETVDLI